MNKNTNMKIGLIVDRLDYDSHGLGNYVYHITKNILELDSNNNYVLIHSVEKKHGSPYCEVFNGTEELLIKPFGFLPSVIKPIFNKYILFPYKLKREKFDIIHEMSQGRPMSFIPQLKIITVHDVVFPSHIVKDKIGVVNIPFHMKISRLLNYYILKNILKKDIRVLCVSNSTKKDLIKYFSVPLDKMDVVYEGVDREVYKPLPKSTEWLKEHNLPLDKKIVLYVGSEEPRKNVPNIIRAFYELKKKYNDVILLKVGSSKWWGARESNLELIKYLELQNSVYFLEHVCDEDMPKIYNSCDVLIYPSLYEGFGLPPLEAMSCGCPVITSNVSSLPEVVGDAGAILDPLDVEGLSNAMYKVLTDDYLREQMINKGVERANGFSWEKAARETIAIYSKIYESN